MNYYNEFDPFAAAWLKQLIDAGLIPAGDIDTRSITDVRPEDLRQYTQCHFFAGIGGWSEALRLAGWSTDRPVWTGSCPCQPFSAASGKEKKAQQDERHLWPYFMRLIRESKPSTIFGEQVNEAISDGWLDDAFYDLEKENYACGAAVLPAYYVENPTERSRIFFVADSLGLRFERSVLGMQKNEKQRNKYVPVFSPLSLRTPPPKNELPAPPICLPNDGVPNRVGRLRGYGNAIVPQVAAEFIKSFMDAN